MLVIERNEARRMYHFFAMEVCTTIARAASDPDYRPEIERESTAINAPSVYSRIAAAV